MALYTFAFDESNTGRTPDLAVQDIPGLCSEDGRAHCKPFWPPFSKVQSAPRGDCKSEVARYWGTYQSSTTCGLRRSICWEKLGPGRHNRLAFPQTGWHLYQICNRDHAYAHRRTDPHAGQIIPSQFRTESAKDELAAYKRTIADFRELPMVITEAGTLMGVRGFGDSDVGTTSAQDVLRIKVMGQIGLHLTLVDLPGLIAVVNEQQTEDDVQAVHSLVDSYVENSRTIILAVVQANNDIANQGIIQKSKRHDRRGERTIGIITKPDMLNTGTEGRIAALARNQDTTRLKLGFFLLKNPSPSELAAGYSYPDREKFERDYFAASPWREQGLDLNRTGVTPLREFLQRLLDQHIERELPKVRDEISLLISRTADDLAALGEECPTPGHMRIFLSRIAMQFHRLVTAALHGDYHGVDAAFFEATDQAADHIRLRALAHNLNTDFADEMRERGQTMIVVPDADSESDGHESASEDLPGIPHRVSREEMNAFVMKVCLSPATFYYV